MSDSASKTVYVLIADGTEEMEFVASYDILVRAGFNARSVGVSLTSPHATCSRGVRITPDIRSLDGIDASSATALVIPGGAPGAKAICGSSQARSLITAFRREGKTVGAICAGTTAIVAAEGEKVKVTSHPSVKEEIVGAGWEYADDTERVVVDGGVVTSRGPGSAIAFALKLVEMLAGKAKADEVRGPMMCAETL